MNWDNYWAAMSAVGVAFGIVGLVVLWGWLALEVFDWPDWVYFVVPAAIIVLGLPFLIGALS